MMLGMGNIIYVFAATHTLAVRDRRASRRASLNASRVVHPRDHSRLGTAILRTHFFSVLCPVSEALHPSFLEREHASFIPRRPTRTRPELPHPHTHYQQDHSPRYGDEGAD